MKTFLHLSALLIGLMLPSALRAANEITTVSQVSETVTLQSDIDYVITDETPFTAEGNVDIVSIDHAVVIFKKVKPSAVISSWLDHICIKGEKAVSGTNCQVKMYDRGTIVLPYASDIQPLTCYTGQDFGGTSCSNYSEGHDSGYMKTLTDETLNNQIRSFRLKRGYMVTFALGVGGWGYSRCFIADKADLEVNLPENMAGRVSSYRIFKWQDAHKAGVANTTDAALMARLDGSWCYTWSVGTNMLPDYECVCNHIYEDYPSSSACGKTEGSCHSKTNNEPGNKSDDTPQTVEQVLDNWQNMMRTGLRLCSESSHDGSMNHLRAFIDSVDARGWRCDLLDLHCYWASGFDKMESYYNSYGKRPIWISEWVWGASWNKNGIFSAAPDGKNSFSEANQQACYDGTVPILETLNASKYVERYAYWNSEADCSKLDKGGTLSLLGLYYASMDEGLGYDASLEKVPNVVYLAPKNLASKFDDETRELTLTWNDANGDMLDSMVVEHKAPGAAAFERVAAIELKDMDAKNGATYSYTDTPDNGTNAYRITVYPIGSKTPKHSSASTVLVVSKKAVWNDVSDLYGINLGFDDSADFQTENLTNGSDKHLAANGWTTTCTDANGSSGVFGLGSTCTINGMAVPEKDADGNAEGGVLGISQGWGISSRYTQKVALPAGTYRISYAIFNAANETVTANLCGYHADGQDDVFDNTTSFATGEWHKASFNPFTLMEDSEITLSLGFTATNSRSTSNPYLFFDYMKIEEADLSGVDDAGIEIVWKDVTDDNIQNYGFDIIDDFITADLANGETSHLNAVGWTTTCADKWGSSAVLPVGSDLKINGQTPPALNAKGEAEGGVLGFSQGWNTESVYTQNVNLPAGTYRMSYAVWNAANPMASVSNRCGLAVTDQQTIYDNLSSFETGSWIKRYTGELTVEESTDVTLSVGFKAANSTSTTNPFLFFDYVKLEQAVVKPNPVNIQSLTSDASVQTRTIYNLGGQKVSALQHGVNIVRYEDGTVKKIFVK